MPANVETMFSVKLTPWHNKGKVIANAPTIEQGIEDAGLNWEVELQSIYRKMADGSDDILNELGRTIVRKDNDKVLGLVGPKTSVLQNRFAFNFFQPFIDSGETFLETAGSLDEDRKIWVLAKINRPNSEIVKGDDVAKFVMLSNVHDGSAAVRVGFTPIRIVCANTLAIAHKDKASKLIRVRHSKDVETNLQKIQETINIADNEFEATAEQYRYLASRQINTSDLKKYIKTVFSYDEDDTKLSTRTKNLVDVIMNRHEERTGMVKTVLADFEERQKVQRQLENSNAVKEMVAELEKQNGEQLLNDIVTRNFESGRGTDNPVSRGSYWTAYNAITETLSYDKGHNDDTRLNSLWFGANANVNHKALEVATEMASGKLLAV